MALRYPQSPSHMGYWRITEPGFCWAIETARRSLCLEAHPPAPTLSMLLTPLFVLTGEGGRYILHDIRAYRSTFENTCKCHGLRSYFRRAFGGLRDAGWMLGPDAGHSTSQVYVLVQKLSFNLSLMLVQARACCRVYTQRVPAVGQHSIRPSRQYTLHMLWSCPYSSRVPS